MSNALYTGDNLYILHGMNSETVDLVYLDPPFNSKRLYKAPVGSKAAGTSFKDMWTWQDVDESYLDSLVEDYPYLVQFIQSVEVIHSKPMMAYLTYMTQRIVEIHRVLKLTGSIYLHCDPTASHYLKILMDRIFGKDNFRNEITWHRSRGKGLNPKRYVSNCDTIFYYTRSDVWTWNQQYEPFAADYGEDWKQDGLGRWQSGDLTGGKSGGPSAYLPFKGVLPAPGRAWAPPVRGKFPPEAQRRLPDAYEQFDPLKKCEALDAAGLIYWPNKVGGKPRYKKYRSTLKGLYVSDLFADIPPIQAHATERTGYPTQKPLVLLHRIIKASSSPGDVVLDPFCGCATTCVAAQQLHRKWIGIDISEKSAELVVDRLSDDAGLFKDFAHLDRPPVRTDLEQCSPDQDAKTRLYADQKGKCNACGVELDIWHLEIDHIIPRSKNGGDYYENYQLLCGHCNRTKGNRPMEYLRAKIKRRNETLKLKVSF